MLAALKQHWHQINSCHQTDTIYCCSRCQQDILVHSLPRSIINYQSPNPPSLFTVTRSDALNLFWYVAGLYACEHKSTSKKTLTDDRPTIGSQVSHHLIIIKIGCVAVSRRRRNPMRRCASAAASNHAGGVTHAPLVTCLFFYKSRTPQQWLASPRGWNHL